jgi:serine/threonine-protein kinase
MAPEQIEGGEVDARADVFGVGVLLYECMVGHLPFDGANPAQVLRRVLDGLYSEAQRERPAVGASWSRILDRALARAPADRYPDATAMREALGAELQRLEIASPERVLEAWIEAPAAFAEAHDKKIIDRLCALANEARRRGDVLSAAADYNRALAHAPADPNLLRIVAGMNRAERRSRVLRRAGWVVLGLCMVAAVPLAVRHLRASPAQPLPTDGSAHAITDGTVAPERSAATSAPSSVEGTEAPSASARGHAPVRDVPRVTERRVILDLKPPMGVTVAIDGQPDRGVSTGDALTLGTRGHVLVFGCPVCTPVPMSVDPGERDSTLVVSVPVKPATLVIDGDVSRTYQLVEHPEIAVRAGTNTVPLRSVYEPVTVKQIETGDTVSVRLEAAKSKRASF